MEHALLAAERGRERLRELGLAAARAARDADDDGRRPGRRVEPPLRPAVHRVEVEPAVRAAAAERDVDAADVVAHARVEAEVREVVERWEEVSAPRRRELRPSGGAVVPVGRRRAEQREKEPEGERVRRGAARHVLFSLMQATSGKTAS